MADMSKWPETRTQVPQSMLGLRVAPFLKLKQEVKILSFNRFDNFRSALLENQELEACRDALKRAGFNADLDVYELGPGKMFVTSELAEPTLGALSMIGRRLKCSDIVVSNEFEPIVRFAVQSHSRRCIYVQNVEVLKLAKATVK